MLCYVLDWLRGREGATVIDTVEDEVPLHHCICCEEEMVPDEHDYCLECLHDPQSARRHKRRRDLEWQEFLAMPST